MSNLQDTRVLFALERTAMAWNRSGFVIEKSNLLVQLIDPVHYQHKIVYTEWLGIAVIVFGLLVNIGSILQYRTGLKSLNPAEFIEGYQTRQPVWLNLFTIFTGILLIISFWIH